MYVYAVIAKLDDFYGCIDVLDGIYKDKVHAEKGMHEIKKCYCSDTKLEVKRFRVNAKNKFFVIVEKNEEAGFYYNDFLHLSTSEKRAKGWKINFENRNKGQKLMIKEFCISE